MKKHWKRRSPIWKASKGEFEDIVVKSDSCATVLAHFGLVNKGGNYKTLRERLVADKLDTSHFRKCFHRMVQDNIASRKPLSDLLVENSCGSRENIKRRIINEGVLKNECYLCGQGLEWKGKSLVLVLDHINGLSTDYRPENLRMLCPNCNSQQETFAGRNNKKMKSCSRCGAVITKHSSTGLCRKCLPKKRKVENRPSKADLAIMVEELGFSAVGRKYGVSGNAVKKWF